MNSDLQEEVEINVRMNQRSMLSRVLCAVVINVVTDLAIVRALSELLYVDDIVLMNNIIEGLGIS